MCRPFLTVSGYGFRAPLRGPGMTLLHNEPFHDRTCCHDCPAAERRFRLAPVEARDRCAHARHARGARRHLDRLRHSLRRRVSHPAQPLEPVGPDRLGRDHGDRHGARHRHAQHRSLGRRHPRRGRHDHRRRAGAVAAGLSRPRALADGAARRAHRRHDRRAHRPVPGLAHRLSRHSLLHRHPRRPAGLARRGLVGHDGPDHRAHGYTLQGLRRRRGRRARRHRHLGHRGDRLRRHHRGFGPRPPPPSAFRLPGASRLGRCGHRRHFLRCRARSRGHRQCLSAACRHGAPLGGGQRHRLARRRPVHSTRRGAAGADRGRRRSGDDLHRHAPPLRPLCLRHRRQSRGCGAVGHQHPLDAR